ncbi:MAG: 2TM domain-containing protein [Methanobrevibacter sp.]|uniref:2TM domain-containing protein n=1 Tax=Methanobrevibacter sp. TaxID=66852 RepID=UPI0015B7F2C4
MSDNIRAVAEKRADAKIEFYKNFISYVVVNAILAVINFLFTPDIWWVLFPLFIWGIGVLFDFLKAFVLYGRFDGEEYRERKIEQEMEKLRK